MYMYHIALLLYNLIMHLIIIDAANPSTIYWDNLKYLPFRDDLYVNITCTCMVLWLGLYTLEIYC